MTRPLRDAPQFYLTSPTTCPYLPGREERKVFTHLVGPRASDLNNVLSQGGFRRSQSIAWARSNANLFFPIPERPTNRNVLASRPRARARRN